MEHPSAKSVKIQCPLCGSSSHSSVRCLHCGALLKKRRFGVSRRTALFVSGILAVIFLQLYFSRREPPLIRIGDISPMLNFSTVRVQGLLVADARRLRSGSVFYRVNDGSGILPVFLIRPPEEELPRAGQRVTIEGNLSVGAGYNRRMHVFSEAQVLLEPERPVKKRAEDILCSEVTAQQEGMDLSVWGRVSRVWVPRTGTKAPYKIILTDASGALEVIHWLGSNQGVTVGDELQVRGRVELYRGKVQLKVWEPSGILMKTER